MLINSNASQYAATFKTLILVSGCFYTKGKSCIVCNFWSFNFRTKISIFQEQIKKTKIQVYILPIS